MGARSREWVAPRLALLATFTVLAQLQLSACCQSHPRFVLHPPPNPPLEQRVAKQFGSWCRIERMCGDLLGIDCNSGGDGPYFYVEANSLEVVANCGGSCMSSYRSGECRDCPPKCWRCPVSQDDAASN